MTIENPHCPICGKPYRYFVSHTAAMPSTLGAMSVCATSLGGYYHGLPAGATFLPSVSVQ